MTDGLDPNRSARSRAVHLFELPAAFHEASGKEIGMVALTADEELSAHQRAKGDDAKSSFELVKASLVEVDGKPLALHDGSVDSYFKEADPKLRQLIALAYTEIHNAKGEDAKAFLKSRKVRVA